MNFFQRRKLKKAVHHMLHVSKHARHTREDIAKPEELQAVLAAEAQLSAAWAARDPKACDAAADVLNTAIEKIYPTPKDAGWRENVEVIAVALAIAMAFRTYLLQPFKIPTGSMMPTLCGIRVDPAATKNWYDSFPFNAVTRFTTGERHVEVVAPVTGYLRPIVGEHQSDQPAFAPSELAATGSKLPKILTLPRWLYHFILGDLQPEECLTYGIFDQPVGGRLLAKTPVATRLHPQGYNRRMPAACYSDQPISNGTVIASGRVLAGDHLFVNRVAYNFKKPERNDIFVFNTLAVRYPNVHTNDFYIKRLVGLPGETIALRDQNLIINGVPLEKPRAHLLADAHTMGTVSEGNGYEQPGDISAALGLSGRPLQLDRDQYLPCGDNTRSSLDGRYFGPIQNEAVVGPACFVYWPFGKRWGIPD